VTEQKMKIDSEGFVHVPEGPGLGVELNEETLDRLRVK
jgi:L-alanine-DL-glutamate epimerase-like enolase superfamily enzyme